MYDFSDFVRLLGIRLLAIWKSNKELLTCVAALEGAKHGEKLKLSITDMIRVTR